MSDSQEPQQQKEKEEEKEQQQQEKQEDDQEEPKSARTPRTSRHNKLYRTPPTPDADVMFERERSFVLDSTAVSSISRDYSRANPKLGSAMPPYNSQKDKSVKPYFKFAGVDRTLQKNCQPPPGTSIEGPVYDRFYVSGHGFKYLTPRNKNQPCGYSNEERMGHGKLWRHPNPEMAKYERAPREFQGYNGRYGYRRTNPNLRREPSTFGVSTETEIY